MVMTIDFIICNLDLPVKENSDGKVWNMGNVLQKHDFFVLLFDLLLRISVKQQRKIQCTELEKTSAGTSD